jgi:predicted DCC family thiol-disulfide oxidoreductase YuxK
VQLGDIKDSVVFFDGECGLCDRFVQQLVRRDKHHRLRFAALQGDTALSMFGSDATNGDRDEWSIKFVDAGGSYTRSTAALRSIAALGGGWRLAMVLLIVPRFIRDAVYRFVATHRYKWFGRLDSCILPSPSLKERFLP